MFRLYGNLPRHYKVNLYARHIEFGIYKRIVGHTEDLRFINPYPFFFFKGFNSEDAKVLQFELIGHIEQVSDHVWSEQVANFPKWERNSFAEYEPHNEPIPIPVLCYMRFHAGRALAENIVIDQ